MLEVFIVQICFLFSPLLAIDKTSNPTPLVLGSVVVGAVRNNYSVVVTSLTISLATTPKQTTSSQKEKDLIRTL